MTGLLSCNVPDPDAPPAATDMSAWADATLFAADRGWAVALRYKPSVLLRDRKRFLLLFEKRTIIGFMLHKPSGTGSGDGLATVVPARWLGQFRSSGGPSTLECAQRKSAV